MSAVARVRRTYFDCRYGQLHVHQAIPPGGGFDEATALLCLPGVRGLGGFYSALLAPLGSNRSIYALDLPGFGSSDAPMQGLGPEQWALAATDLLDSLHQRRVDVLAHAEGAATALALKKQRPSLVRRMAWSAAPASVASQARTAGVAWQELPLAAAGDEALSAASVRTHLDEIIKIFNVDAAG